MLLIREYDSIINNALIEIEGNSQLRGIVSLTSDILMQLFCDIIHLLVFYGLTEDEVGELFHKEFYKDEFSNRNPVDET